MTEIEKQALALINEVLRESGKPAADGAYINRELCEYDEILCRAIERHEVFRQEVSDAVEPIYNALLNSADGNINWRAEELGRFIITKADPLREAWAEAFGHAGGMLSPALLVEALAARGLEIVEKKP